MSEKQITEVADSVELFRQMADHTSPRCGGPTCGRVGPDRCCSPIYCEEADRTAREKGIQLPRQDHPRLPFMGVAGCIVPPHLRPLCTLHDCVINGVGEDADVEWTERYFDLRDAINSALYEEEQITAQNEEAEDRRRDNPLEPDYRRMGQ